MPILLVDIDVYQIHYFLDKLILKCTVFSIYLLIFLSPSALSDTAIKLGVENSWPPYSDSLGNGISKVIIQKAFDAMNVEVKFYVFPYARVLKMTEDGELDGAFNVTKQASTIDKFNFHQIPLFYAHASFYYPPNSTLNYQNVNEIPDNTIIALIIDYEYEDQYEANRERFNEVRVSKQKQIVQLLLKQRVDMAIMFDDVAKYTLEQMELPVTTIKKGFANHTSEIFVAFSKVRATDKMIKQLDQGLRKINNTKNIKH